MKFKHYLLILFMILSLFLFSFLFYSNNNSKLYSEKLLKQANVKIDGENSSDIIVHNENLYPVVMQYGSLGLGEAYMNGWWDSPELDQFFYKILSADLKPKINMSFFLNYIKSILFNFQSKDRAFQVGEQHYDLSNDLFKNMLDSKMIYSCAYWKNANNLEKAQDDKLDLICKKLYLKPGMKILDIGCGWGGFAYYAAKNYSVEVVGLTISKEQAEYAREYCKGLPVTILLKDYRDLNEIFDRIVSVGMFEHVGCKNYKEFLQISSSCLKDDGLFLLHTIGNDFSNCVGDPWLDKYIFPNGVLPSIAQIGTAIENLFVMEDWHNFGADYDKTLMVWYNNFNKNWDKIKSNHNEKFYRMWKYYLLSCAGLFRARKAQLWQIILSKNGVPGGYVSLR